MIGKVLTIAGSDPSGGAGIQADIKTITMHGHYAMSVITSLTAQNTTEVSEIFDIPADFVEKQLDAVFTDIFPDAVKIGMVSSPDIIEVISESLRKYGAKNIVADPVMVSTSGCRLISQEAEDLLCRKLLVLADIVTPNVPEAEQLTGLSIATVEDMKKAAEKLSEELNTSVLVKGGHISGSSVDALCGKDGSLTLFEGERINSRNTHGTGCTLSSAIASNLAGGASLADSVRCAKDYISEALKAGLDIGKGSGPLNHFFKLNK